MSDTTEPVTALVADLPRSRSSVLPALLRVQRAVGYCSNDAITAIARHVRLTSNDVEGIATGYPELRRVAPRGLLTRVCGGLSCVMLGAESLRAELEAREGPLGIEVETAACLFTCALAPVVEVNGAGVGRATIQSVERAVQRA